MKKTSYSSEDRFLAHPEAWPAVKLLFSACAKRVFEMQKLEKKRTHDGFIAEHYDVVCAMAGRTLWEKIVAEKSDYLAVDGMLKLAYSEGGPFIKPVAEKIQQGVDIKVWR